MSFRLYENDLFIRSKSTGELVPIGMVASGADASLREIAEYAEQKVATTKTQMDTDAQAARESIPADYTALSDDVNELKGDLTTRETGYLRKYGEIVNAYFNVSQHIWTVNASSHTMIIPVVFGKTYTIRWAADCNYKRYAFSKDGYAEGGTLFEPKSLDSSVDAEVTITVDNPEYKYLAVYFWWRTSAYPTIGHCYVLEHAHALDALGVIGASQLSPVYRNFRKNLLGDFSWQSICWDSDKQVYYIVGGSTSNNGTAKICVTKSLYDFSEAVFHEFAGGHAGAAAYSKDSKKLYIGTGGSAYGSDCDLLTLDTDNYSVVKKYSLGHNVYGIIPTNKGFYVDSGAALYYYSSDFENSYTLATDTSETVVAAYLGANPSHMEHQNSIMHNGYIYTLYSWAHKDTWRDAALLAVRTVDGKLIKYINIDNLSQSAEAESLIIRNNVLYIIYTGDYVEIASCRLDGVSQKAPTYIPEWSDLNNYMAVGEYFCNNTDITKHIDNRPLEISAGFTLIVKTLARNCIMQIYIPSLSINSSECPIYMRRFYEKWSSWFVFNGVAVPPIDQT